jgi:predicted nucleic acid-binding protein
MDVFFDTSVLVASSSLVHQHFAQASAAVARVAAGEDKGYVSQHSIAEVYAVLTRMPVVPRIHPLEAARIIRDNILQNFEAIPIEEEDYMEALAIVSNAGWPGANIYDALMLRCAGKCPAQRIYTFNLKDFKQLAPGRMQDLICAP